LAQVQTCLFFNLPQASGGSIGLLQAPDELGVVFYQMLTGELPERKIEPPFRKVAIDVRLDEVVLRALEKRPELRYQQASILKTQVETIANTPHGSSPARRDESALAAGVEPHQMKTKELAAVVLRIVELEGPVHEDEVINRVRELWGLGRAGARIQDAVAKAVRSLLDCEVDAGQVPSLRFRSDTGALAHLVDTQLGKTLLFTDNDDWSDEEIVSGYRADTNSRLFDVRWRR
jgi:hypothetical protein